MARESLSADDAEKIAVSALGFLAGRPEHLGRFLAETGLGPETIRAAASDPRFLAAVLAFLMGDEAVLLEFTEALRLRPTLVAIAHHRLAGERGE
ncbi:DUF3572 domain-containing protein [Prosthecomicrobium sp. N25]|uniref:DUF3572 domain-containing protein n=1 Tax=Prosthecomicrobium sp. N25 TaxID=3129254 RepID=UPI003077F55C